MASVLSGRVSVALRSLLLCMLLLLPVLMADRGPLVGGWHDRSVSDPDVQDAAAFAVNHYNKASNSVFLCRALDILKAQSQVVEGVRFHLKILLAKTQCDKRSRPGLTQVDLEGCALARREEQERTLCKAFVWSRPWLNDTRVTYMKCGQAS